MDMLNINFFESKKKEKKKNAASNPYDVCIVVELVKKKLLGYFLS